MPEGSGTSMQPLKAKHARSDRVVKDVEQRPSAKKLLAKSTWLRQFDEPERRPDSVQLSPISLLHFQLQIGRQSTHTHCTLAWRLVMVFRAHSR